MQPSITSTPVRAMSGNLNRVRVAAVCMFTQIILGVLYTWTVFRGPLTKLHGWSESQTIAPYRYSLLALALGTVIAGIVQDRKGPRFVEIISGILLGTGMLLASFFTDSVPGLIICYGILGGLGVGFGYVAPIATCIKWFPDKRGFIAGLAVLGSGIGPVFYGPFLQSLIGSDASKFGETIPKTFLILAVLFYVTVIGAAMFYRVPPAGWKPENWQPSPSAAKAAGIDASIGGVLRTWQFYALYVIYFLGASVGLTVIGQAGPLLDTAGTKAAAVSIGLAVGLVSVFNAGGRLSWGALSDRFGRKAMAISTSAVSVLACLVFLRPVSGFWPVMLGLALAAFSYGGWLAIMPSFIADYYGQKNVGTNYGFLFSAWGLTGFIAPGYFTSILDRQRAAGNLLEGYNQMFTQLAILAAGALVLALILRKPELPAANIR